VVEVDAVEYRLIVGTNTALATVLCRRFQACRDYGPNVHIAASIVSRRKRIVS
jgi:hypothetical protein